ncbi:glutathione S-transferase family protein [Cupriavidus sp. 8B]
MQDVYMLYGAQISNYTAKVRSYLIFKGITFQEMVASNAVYDSFLVPRIGYRMMPVLWMPDGKMLQDSTDIIDELEARFPRVSVYPSSPALHLANLLVEAYAHDWVRIPAMYYRWAFLETNYEYLKAEFGRMYEPMAQAGQQLVVGEKGCAWARDRLPSLGVVPETAAEIERWTENLLRWLDAHFEDHDYLFGSRPSTSDFAFMGPLYAHFYRDLYSSALLQRNFPNVVCWVERMNLPAKEQGEYFGEHEVPETLIPVLQHMFAEYVPVACDTIDRVADWIDANYSSPIPRLLGTQDFTIGTASSKRNVWTCIQYMFQRPLFYYQRAPETAKREMDVLLARIGADARLDKVVRHPVRHRNHRLVVDK